ncbi:MAG: hypothetical protein PVG66_06275 [Chromatiales bacterium]|jgi:hypothetical protein
MSQTAMTRTLDIIRAAPHSATALTLYALVNTLVYEQGGCLFKLTKLRDLEPAERQLAYELMEMMALEQNRSEEFEQIKQEMDQLVRSG